LLSQPHFRSADLLIVVILAPDASTRRNITTRPKKAVGPVTRSLKRGQGMSRQLGAAGFTSEMGRYLPVNILDSGRSGRLGLDAVG